MASDSIEYICRYCGKKMMTFQSRGRPAPGNCPRKSGGPHSWAVNRRFKAGSGNAKPEASKATEYICRNCRQKK